MRWSGRSRRRACGRAKWRVASSSSLSPRWSRSSSDRPTSPLGGVLRAISSRLVGVQARAVSRRSTRPSSGRCALRASSSAASSGRRSLSPARATKASSRTPSRIPTSWASLPALDSARRSRIAIGHVGVGGTSAILPAAAFAGRRGRCRGYVPPRAERPSAEHPEPAARGRGCRLVLHRDPDVRATGGQSRRCAGLCLDPRRAFHGGLVRGRARPSLRRDCRDLSLVVPQAARRVGSGRRGGDEPRREPSSGYDSSSWLRRHSEPPRSSRSPD